MSVKLSYENLKEKEPRENLDVDGMIMLKCILTLWGVKVWTVLSDKMQQRKFYVETDQSFVTEHLISEPKQ